MKCRIFPLLLAAVLALSVSALAAPAEGGFARTKHYEGQFSDLSPDSVFYDNVAALYEYGLSVGRPDGTYGLGDTISLGEMVIFTGRIRSLYTTGDPEAGRRRNSPPSMTPPSPQAMPPGSLSPT